MLKVDPSTTLRTGYSKKSTFSKHLCWDSTTDDIFKHFGQIINAI